MDPHRPEKTEEADGSLLWDGGKDKAASASLATPA